MTFELVKIPEEKLEDRITSYLKDSLKVKIAVSFALKVV